MPTKICLIVCAVAVGAFSAANAFVNGMQLVPGWVGYLAGTALVALLVLSGLFGKLAAKSFACRAWVSGLIFLAYWFGATALVLGMSVGSVAHHRTEKVGAAQLKIDGYQREEANWQRLTDEIKAADARGAVKRAAGLRQELKAVEAELKVGRPASSDAQAETLSWVTGSRVDPATIGKALPIWLAVTLDLAFNGALTATGLVGNGPQQKARPVKKRKFKRSPRRKAKVLRFPQITRKKKLSLVAANESH